MTMHNPPDEDLMAYVDGELDNQSELKDHIAANIDKYYARMWPFIFTRRLMKMLWYVDDPVTIMLVLDLSNTDELGS